MKKSLWISMALLPLCSLLTAQVKFDNVIELVGSDGVCMIHYLELPVNGTDAVNKDYVDAAVSASGGGSCVPSMISNESSSDFTYAGAAYYCSSLTEGGHSDWRLPTHKEIQYYAGIPGASTNFLWTNTPSGNVYVVNQNFVSVRLSGGAWHDGEEQLMSVELKGQTSATSSTVLWNSTATLNPSTAGNWLKITDVVIRTMRGSARLKFNFPNGASSYSLEHSNNATSLSNVLTWNISDAPIVVESIGIEGYSNGAGSNTVELSIKGFEIIPTQKAGNTLYAHCVR